MVRYNPTISRSDSVEGIGHLAGPWRRLQHHPNTDFDHYLLYLQHHQQICRPWVLALHAGSGTDCVVVGRTQTGWATANLGYWTLKLGRMKSLTICTEGVLGEMSPEAADVVVRNLLAALEAREVERVVIRNLRTSHPLASVALHAPRRFLPTCASNPQTHWRMQLPESAAAFWSSLTKKHRYWLKRLERKLASDFPNDVSFELMTEPGKVGEFCGAVEQVASKTYQRGLGVGFKNDEFHLNRCRLFAEKKALRGHLLRVAGVPRAFWLGVVYRGTFHSEYTGYDPTMRSYELGSVLFAHITEMLIAEQVHTIDFGLGDAVYKQRFGTESWEECDVALFAPTARNFVIAAASGAANRASLLAKRLPIARRIKRLWRDRAAQAHAGPPPDDTQG